MSIGSVMPSNHLILCRPLLLPPSVFPSIRVFSNESALCIRWPKYWSFTFSISPGKNFPGKSIGVGCHFLLRRIFPTQGSNPGLPRCGQTLYPLSHQGSPLYIIVCTQLFPNSPACFFDLPSFYYLFFSFLLFLRIKCHAWQWGLEARLLQNPYLFHTWLRLFLFCRKHDKLLLKWDF